MNKRITRLSKSQYLKGLQCPKALWLYRHQPDLATPVSELKQWIFDSGHEVGIVAQSYFGDGLLIDEPYYEIDKAIETTVNGVSDGQEVIFEAAACSDDGAYSKIDIFQNVDGKRSWNLIEVKQSTGVKDYYLDDIALQRYAFTGAGYDVRKSILMHLNRDYVRFGDLDPQQLFILEDCTKLAESRMTMVPPNLADLFKAVNQAEEPQIPIGRHCKNPFDCDFKDYCWQNVPEYSVFNVFGGAKLDSLLAMNVIDVADIPDSFPLTDRQRKDINAHQTPKAYADKASIRNFLGSLVYPLYYLDYETIFPALPLFDNSSPYQQIPFQFSLHIQRSPGGNLEHIDFLHTDSTDPRPNFVKALIGNCGSQGSVVVYNKGFESRINRELGATYPLYSSALADINSRMVDLMAPFKSKHLYHPKMLGSASIKKVLPAFVSELSYDGMEISDGDMASRKYQMCLKGKVSEAEKEIIYRDLLRYCEMDTYAEVKLVEKLYEMV